MDRVGFGASSFSGYLNKASIANHSYDLILSMGKGEVHENHRY
jgi:hypothetical protein